MSKEQLQEDMKNFLDEVKWTQYMEEILKDLKFFYPEDPWIFLYEKGGMRQSK